MKYIKWVIGGIIAVLFMIVLLFSTVEGITFHLDHYEHEYQKHNIINDVGMTKEELLTVTEKMLEYLKGNRLDLNMQVQINGTYREVFNEKEKAHMVDVQDLFLKGYRIRNFSILFIIILAVFLVLWDQQGIYKIFRSIQIVISIIMGMAVILAVLLYIDFNKYFTVFHQLFFTNDLWLLDPRTDLLIRIVPEPFFFDTAIKIVTYFVIEIISFFIISMGIVRYQKQKSRG